jgi:hypothetical protein
VRYQLRYTPAGKSIIGMRFTRQAGAIFTSFYKYGETS